VIHDDRARFITHQSEQILQLDMSQCSAREVEGIFRELPDIVTTRPLGSVLILSDFTAASFDAEAIRVLKETAVFDKPFVRKSAFVGTENPPQGFVENLKSFSRREFPTFQTRDKALAWLMKD
jgi:hypothetical protein